MNTLYPSTSIHKSDAQINGFVQKKRNSMADTGHVLDTPWTHWVQVMHIHMSVTWVSIGSGNGVTPGRCQAITWTNADLFLNKTLRIKIGEMWMKMSQFSVKQKFIIGMGSILFQDSKVLLHKPTQVKMQAMGNTSTV